MAHGPVLEAEVYLVEDAQSTAKPDAPEEVPDTETFREGIALNVNGNAYSYVVACTYRLPQALVEPGLTETTFPHSAIPLDHLRHHQPLVVPWEVTRASVQATGLPPLK